MHDVALPRFGGMPGVKDQNALESSLARPENHLAYSDPDSLDLLALAAIYAAGVAANHASNDGNKRTVWASCSSFLALNGITLTIAPPEAANKMVALATPDIDDIAFAQWLRAHNRPA